MELTRSNAELEQFAYVASHDLQEPLRKIQAFGDLLAATAGVALDEQGRLYVERMQDAARRMQGLINDLLTFARLTSQARAFEEVDLARVAQEVVSDLEERLRRTGGRVEVGELPRLQSDPTQMRQLLQNLVGNALKFHRPEVPPVVVLRYRPLRDVAARGRARAAALCEIAVEDNGIGIEEKYLERIFAPFQRLHGRGEYEGTGMGLAICRKIVERHGGRITAHSTPGQGTTFLVTLPLHQTRGEHHV
jgi:light-regulated signal transduction histidine kinase (bacteriophytochrome)